MRFLAAGFALVVGVFLVTLGWGAWRAAMLTQEKVTLFDRTWMVIVALVSAGLGAALTFAALDWMKP